MADQDKENCIENCVPFFGDVDMDMVGVEDGEGEGEGPSMAPSSRSRPLSESERENVAGPPAKVLKVLASGPPAKVLKVLDLRAFEQMHDTGDCLKTITVGLSIPNIQEKVRRVLNDEDEAVIESTSEVGPDLTWYHVAVTPKQSQDGTTFLNCSLIAENSTSHPIQWKAVLDFETTLNVHGGDMEKEDHMKDCLIEIAACEDSTGMVYSTKLILEDSMTGFEVKATIKFIESNLTQNPCNRTEFRMAQVMEIKKELTKFAEAVQHCAKYGLYSPETENFKIQCNNGQVVGFHKDLLKARSGPALRSLLYAEVDDGKDDDLLKTSDSEALWLGFKSYIYYGGIPDLVDKCDEYYGFAAKYGIANLKELCDIIMVQKLSDTNLKKFHKVAGTLDTKYLRTEIIRFFMAKQERVHFMFDNNFNALHKFYYND